MRVLPHELYKRIHNLSCNGCSAALVIFAGRFVGGYCCGATMVVGHSRCPSDTGIALRRWTTGLARSKFAFTKLSYWFNHCPEWSLAPNLIRLFLDTDFSDSDGDWICDT
jgi:hypothetical protein